MECDVLIVGAGPTGLTLAAELRLHQPAHRSGHILLAIAVGDGGEDCSISSPSCGR